MKRKFVEQVKLRNGFPPNACGNDNFLNRNTETPRHRNTGTPRHRNTGTPKHRNTIFIVAILSILLLSSSVSRAATLKSIHNMSGEANVNVLLGIVGDVEWNAFTLNGPPRLVIDLADTGSDVLPYESDFRGELLLGLRAAKYKENMVRVVLDLKYLAPFHVKKTQMGDVEIFVSRDVPEEREKTTLAPGITYERVVENRPDGPLTYHAVEVDPRAGYRVGIAGAAGGFGKLEALSGIAKREGALLGVNGGYFDMKSGMPIGLLVAGGRALSLDGRYRAFFGVDAAGKPVFMTPTAEAAVECAGEARLAGGARLYVHRLNSAPQSGERAVFTPEYKGKRTANGEARREYAVSGNVVREVRDAEGEIPAGGFVLSAPAGEVTCGDGVLGTGDALKKLITSYPDLSGVRAGFSAGPMLVEDGMRKTSLIEDFTVSSGIVAERNPRTAVGVTGDGRLIFIVVEGRSIYSAGLYLDELARLLAERGAKTGMNLDGGGSSELFAGGKILNRISDGKERSISNAILIYKK